MKRGIKAPIKPVKEAPKPIERKPNYRVAKWFPDLAPEAQVLLAKFHSELLKFNQAINLISTRSIEDADLTHFADSILGARMVGQDLRSDEVYDFGSGNGFPAIVLACLYPKIKVVMVESDRRKAEFLKHVVSSLGLSNTSILVLRVEDLPEESVSAAICRGFANLSRTLLISRRAFIPKGRLYSLKGPEWAYEIAELPFQICSTWNTILLGEYKLPETDIDHSVVLATKIK